MKWECGTETKTVVLKKDSCGQNYVSACFVVERQMIISINEGATLNDGNDIVCVINEKHPTYDKNKKLIEAAPELLSTLREVYELTEGAFDDPVIPDVLYNKMDELIKKLQ